jgi:hypothetical protein
MKYVLTKKQIREEIKEKGTCYYAGILLMRGIDGWIVEPTWPTKREMEFYYFRIFRKALQRFQYEITVEAFAT